MEAFLLFVILVVGLVGAYRLYRFQQTKKTWSAFADRHDLTYQPGGILSDFHMRGECDGRDLTVRTEKRRYTKHKKRLYTVYKTPLSRDIPVGLELYDESLFAKLGKVFGGEDIQVGRPALDDAFIIKGANPDRVTEFLDDSRVAGALLELHAVESNVDIDRGVLQIEHRGPAHRSTKLQSYVSALTDCASVLDERAAALKQTPELDWEREDASAESNQKGQRSEEIDYVAEW